MNVISSVAKCQEISRRSLLGRFNLIYNNSLIVDGEIRFKNISQLTLYRDNVEAYVYSKWEVFVFASNRNQKNSGDTNLFICEWKEI